MVKLGIENILDIKDMLKSKRVGLITNHTGVDKNLKSSIEILREHSDLRVLFAPEHGLDGLLQAGEKVGDQQRQSQMIYSLYGKHRRPSEAMLKDLDIICFDIQDVGARFYTYISTLYETLHACKQYHKQVIVFDRPNPVGGIEIEGNFLASEFKSFVGVDKFIQRYGLTIGELSLLFNDHFHIHANLHVVKMSQYKRTMNYKDTNLFWILPSPNIPTMETTYVYLATCYFEGTNVSEGRGTTKPFYFVGAPWMKPDLIKDELEKLGLPGVLFRQTTFTPTFSKYKDEICKGIEIIITDYSLFKPVLTGYALIKIIQSSHLEFKFLEPYTEFGRPMIDLLTGDSDLRTNRLNLDALKEKILLDTYAFKLIKERYHLYD
jgi:uncharacterized protein YbbC (DUF1343 family)